MSPDTETYGMPGAAAAADRPPAVYDERLYNAAASELAR